MLAAVLIVLGGVQVPDVTGKTQAEATKALEDAGLKAGGVTSTSDAEAPAGTVVRQDPAAGTEVDDGSAVALVVSSGPGTAAVPDVVGMDRSEAETALADAGFVPASAMQYDLTAPAGQVVEQLPAAGDQAAAGSQVGLLVSKGRPEVSVSVPDVTGMTQDQATTALADAGLIAVPVEVYFAGVPAGDVAEQEPAAGDRVSPLSEVLVTVSLGEGTTSIVVPDVVGQRQAKATSELEAAGLAVTVAKAWSADVVEGVVIAQEPKAGVKVEKGGDAGILVSLGALPSPYAHPVAVGIRGRLAVELSVGVAQLRSAGRRRGPAGGARRPHGDGPRRRRHGRLASRGCARRARLAPGPAGGRERHRSRRYGVRATARCRRRGPQDVPGAPPGLHGPAGAGEPAVTARAARPHCVVLTTR